MENIVCSHKDCKEFPDIFLENKKEWVCDNHRYINFQNSKVTETGEITTLISLIQHVRLLLKEFKDLAFQSCLGIDLEEAEDFIEINLKAIKIIDDELEESIDLQDFKKLPELEGQTVQLLNKIKTNK